MFLSFFFPQDFPNCFIGYAQCLCYGSARFSFVSQLPNGLLFFSHRQLSGLHVCWTENAVSYNPEPKTSANVEAINVKGETRPTTKKPQNKTNKKTSVTCSRTFSTWKAEGFEQKLLRPELFITPFIFYTAYPSWSGFFCTRGYTTWLGEKGRPHPGMVARDRQQLPRTITPPPSGNWPHTATEKTFCSKK